MNHFAFTITSPELFTAMQDPKLIRNATKAAEWQQQAEANTEAQRAKGPGLTEEQLLWARSHDWHVIPCYNARVGFGVIVKEDGTFKHDDGDVQELTTITTFHNYTDLCAWAGY